MYVCCLLFNKHSILNSYLHSCGRRRTRMTQMCSSSIFSNTCRHPTVTTKQHRSSTNVDNGNTIRWSGVRPSPVCVRRHGTGSLGHRVNGSFGSSFTSGSPGYHFDPVRDTRGFSRFSKKCPKAKRTFEMLKWQKSLSGVCSWTEIIGCQSM